MAKVGTGSIERFPLPVSGLHESAGPSGVPAGFCVHCKNVVPYTRQDRIGIGKRDPLANNWGLFGDSATSTLYNLHQLANPNGSTGNRNIGVVFGATASGGFAATFDLDRQTTGSKATASASYMPYSSTTGGFLGRSLYVSCANTTATAFRPSIINVTDPTSISVMRWDTNMTAGTFPMVDTGGGTMAFPGLCATWRARIVLARFGGSEIFMSRVGDGRDFDFNAFPVSTSAWVGLAAEGGQPGDAITALIPYSDDYIIFGCRKSLWRMIGDPQDGGRLYRLTSDTGVATPNAWCFDDQERLWFVGNGELWYLDPGTFRPVPVTNGRLRRTLGRLNYGESFFINLAFDNFEKAVCVYLSDSGADLTTVVKYYRDLDQVWLEELKCEVRSAMTTAGDDDELRRPVITSTWRSGVLTYRNSGQAVSDITDPTGTYAADNSIDVELDWPPFQPGSGRHESLALQLRAFQGGDDAGGQDETFTLQWHIDSSPAKVMDQADGDAVWSDTFGGNSVTGFNTPRTLRKRGNAHQLRLRQDSAHADSNAGLSLDVVEVDIVPVAQHRRIP